MADRPILDLTTPQTRPFVKINGIAYDLRTSNDLTLQAFRTLERITPQIGALLQQPELSDAEATTLSTLLAQGCAIGLDAPADVLKGLGDVGRIQVFKVFAELSTPSLQRAGANLAARPAPGTKPSRGSSGSTGARNASGSPRRRSGSSGRG